MRVPSILSACDPQGHPSGAHGIALIDPERVKADLPAFIKGEMKS
jgi:hypothetical protein